MMTGKNGISKTASLAGAAVFGALAAVTTFSIQIPYPVPGFTFLVVDPAELVDVLGFLLFGPSIGLLTTVVHWIVLNFLPSASPVFGPLLKLFGVTTMLLGMWLGHWVYSRLSRGKGGRAASGVVMLTLGLVARVALMTPINYLFYIFVFAPNSPTSVSFWEFYLGGLAVYNGLHTLFSIIVPFFVLGALSRAAPDIEVRTWFSRMMLGVRARTSA